MGNILARHGAGTFLLKKSNTSTWTLSGSNSYAGGTSVAGGVLNITNTAALGAAGSTITFNSTTGGTLALLMNSPLANNNYNVAETTSNSVGTILMDTLTSAQVRSRKRWARSTAARAAARIICMLVRAPTPRANDTGLYRNQQLWSNERLHVDGYLPLSSRCHIGQHDAHSGIRRSVRTETLYLDGTSANNAITGGISNNNSSGTLAIGAVTKQGTSIWTLSGTNTYTGGTTISGGTLVVTNPQGLGMSTGSSAITFGGGVLSLLSSNGNTTTTFGPNNGTTGYNIALNTAGPLTFNVDQLGSGTNGTIALGNVTDSANNSTTFDIIGGHGFSLSLGTLTTGSDRQYTFVPTTASVTLAAAVGKAGTGPSNLILDGTCTGNAVLGNITQSSTFEVTKQNTSTWTLSGSNTYTGGTTISAGVLEFGPSYAMPPSGTVSVSGGATLAVRVGGSDEFTNATSGSGSVGGLLTGIGGQGGAGDLEFQALSWALTRPTPAAGSPTQGSSPIRARAPSRSA